MGFSQLQKSVLVEVGYFGLKVSYTYGALGIPRLQQPYVSIHTPHHP